MKKRMGAFVTEQEVNELAQQMIDLRFDPITGARRYTLEDIAKEAGISLYSAARAERGLMGYSVYRRIKALIESKLVPPVNY